MRIKLILIPLFFVSFFCYSQNDAKSVMDKVSAVYSNEIGFVLDFTLNTEDTQSKITYSHDGKAYIKGNKFKIEVPDGITWFDGKTQWVFMNGGDEVNVSNPSGEELAAISPVALLNLYKSGFKLSKKEQKTQKGQVIYVIEMIPVKRGSDILKIVLSVDRVSYRIASITLEGKDKVNNHLLVRSQARDTNMLDNVFVFDKKKYPDVEIIDLR